MQWYHYTAVEVMSYMSCEVELRQYAGMSEPQGCSSMCGTSMLCIDDCGVYIDCTHLYAHDNAMVVVSGILYSSSEVELRQSAPQVSHRDAGLW